jgi:dihydropteroate synthase
MKTIEKQQFVYRFGKRTYDLSDRTHLMGVLNVTPDSFSDGGMFIVRDAAVEHALQMVEDGADIIDVGGESTRPKSQAYGEGADVISTDEELYRVIPVIERLVGHTEIPISIDTYKSEVAREALRAGASIVNDISGFTFDQAMPAVVAEAGASAVVMHIQGTPKTMQQNPTYQNLIGEISVFLEESVAKGRRAGIDQIIVDPGIGFGKRLEHNLQLIGQLKRLTPLGCPILVGPSRKSFIGALLDLPVNERLEGSLAAAAACILNGAHILRVHDVKETKRAARIADAIRHTMTEPT